VTFQKNPGQKKQKRHARMLFKPDN